MYNITDQIVNYPKHCFKTLTLREAHNEYQSNSKKSHKISWQDFVNHKHESSHKTKSPI